VKLRSIRKRRIIVPTIIVFLLAVFAVAGIRIAASIVLGPALDDAQARMPHGVRIRSDKASWRTRNVLVIGSDARPGDSEGASDSVMVMRVDPIRGRVAMLSIPRDLMVADAHGRAAHLADTMLDNGAGATVSALERLDIEIDDVAITRFNDLVGVVDDLGGVDIDNPHRIAATSSFDGRRWRFGKGPLHLDGRRALAYARVRTNVFSKNETDSDRALRQQRVIQAIVRKLRAQMWRHPRRAAKTSLQGAATTLEPTDALAIAQALARGRGEVLHCRLGGDLQGISPGRPPLMLLKGTGDSKIPKFAHGSRAAVARFGHDPRAEGGEGVVDIDVNSGLYLLPSQKNPNVISHFQAFQQFGTFDSTPLAAACDR
jgi:LCP family protein required for cell wall assembly